MVTYMHQWASTKGNRESQDVAACQGDISDGAHLFCKYFSKCVPVQQTSCICCCCTNCKNQKGWQALFVWANAKFAWVGPGFKSMRSNYELTADLLMVPLGAQAGCCCCSPEPSPGCFWAKSLIFLWFSRDAFNLPENESCHKFVCMQIHFGFYCVDGKFVAPGCVACFELLPHLSLGLERTKSARYAGEQWGEDTPVYFTCRWLLGF